MSREPGTPAWHTPRAGSLVTCLEHHISQLGWERDQSFLNWHHLVSLDWPQWCSVLYARRYQGLDPGLDLTDLVSWSLDVTSGRLLGLRQHGTTVAHHITETDFPRHVMFSSKNMKHSPSFWIEKSFTRQDGPILRWEPSVDYLDVSLTKLITLKLHIPELLKLAPSRH